MTINEKGRYIFELSDYKNTIGAIVFTILKNHKKVKEVLVYSSYSTTYEMNLDKGDHITIIAKSQGGIYGERGGIRILKYDKHYILELRIAVLLWFLFFLYLMQKRYIYIALSSYLTFLLILTAEKMTFGKLFCNILNKSG